MMFAHHARNSFGGLHLIKLGSNLGFIIAHDASINGMKDPKEISGISEYAKENEVNRKGV